MVKKPDPKRPPAPPQSTKQKGKESKSARQNAEKLGLNKVQLIQVEIIDAKRCSVRSLLLIAIVTLLHILIYLTVFAYGYTLISKSNYLKSAFFGFFLDLLLYFFGSGAALKAISFVWMPFRFTLGIAAIIVGIVINVTVFFVGVFETKKYSNFILPVDLTEHDCEPEKTELDEDLESLCKERKPVEIALLCMPIILPPISVVCVILACVSAINAVKKIPLKLRKGEVDPKWLEPYETYDFYVGRNIPRIPGYDEVFPEDNTKISAYFGSDDDDEEEDETTLDSMSVTASEASVGEAKTVVESGGGEGTTASTAPGKKKSIVVKKKDSAKRKNT